MLFCGLLLFRWVKPTEPNSSVLLHLLKSSAWHHNFFGCKWWIHHVYRLRFFFSIFLIWDSETPSNKFQLLFNSSVFTFFPFQTSATCNTSTHTGKVFQILCKSSWVLFYIYCYSTFMCKICLVLSMWSYIDTRHV